MTINEDIDFEKSAGSQETESPEVVKVLTRDPEKIESPVKQESEPKEDLSGPDLSEPDIMSPPKEVDTQLRSFDNEPAIISGQSATFETHDSETCLNLYQRETFTDIQDLFEKHTTQK